MKNAYGLEGEVNMPGWVSFDGVAFQNCKEGVDYCNAKGYAVEDALSYDLDKAKECASAALPELRWLLDWLHSEHAKICQDVTHLHERADKFDGRGVLSYVTAENFRQQARRRAAEMTGLALVIQRLVNRTETLRLICKTQKKEPPT